MATFSTSSKQHQPRYVYLEISERSGDSLVSNVGGVKQAQNAATSLVFATLSDLMALVYRQYEGITTDYEAACPSPAVQAALLSKRLSTRCSANINQILAYAQPQAAFRFEL